MVKSKSQIMTEAIDVLKNPSMPEWRKRKAVAVLLLGDMHNLSESYGLDPAVTLTALLQTVGVWFGANGFGPSNDENMAALLNSAKEIIADTLDDYLSLGVDDESERKFAAMVRDKDSKLH